MGKSPESRHQSRRLPCLIPSLSYLVLLVVTGGSKHLSVTVPNVVFMSFADLEAGRSSAQPLRVGLGASASGPDAAFLQLQSSLSMQVFKINANVQGISKLVDQLGTSRDTGAVRKGLHDLTETTREMAKRGTEDLKRLTTMQQPLVDRLSHVNEVVLNYCFISAAPEDCAGEDPT